ncbi:drug/metabolite transporter (DMT)-like permease [Spinactinospora alkalitolerans]|uniref:Drug/metabolite transporter (DMT)-like permease n=2 Tax=Spinactinospora alkalitolerans TaxID=687207 RepID=A0A852TYX6_9ACTN|nr:drug/metabolite transporter (DMT)-like permease [Spinactinospora alkalitolerans]
MITMLVAALALTSERLTRHRSLGLGLGFLGVVTIIGPWNGLGAGHSLTAQFACLGATNAAAVTHLSPVVGAVLGIVLLGEPLRWYQPLGAVLVILGIMAAHGRLPWTRSRPSRRQPSTKDQDMIAS